MENLDPYLADSEIRLVEPVLNALRVDGKLYSLSAGFLLQGLVCSREYSQDGGISIRQCMDMAGDHPDTCFMKNAGHSQVLDLMLSADMVSYMNMRDRTCRFDSEDFIGLLDMVKGWKEPANDGESGFFASPDELSRKKYLVEEVSVLSMVDYLATQRVIRSFGTLAGYPNSGGKAVYRVLFTNLYGMNSASRVKDGAWDFLAYLISEENQKRSASYFPMTEESFRASLEKGLAENEFYFSVFTGQREAGLVPTPQDIEDMWKIVEHVYYSDYQQSVISDIISEETGAVFDGKKTSGEAAEKIQNRVSLFLAE